MQIFVFSSVIFCCCQRVSAVKIINIFFYFLIKRSKTAELDLLTEAEFYYNKWYVWSLVLRLSQLCVCITNLKSDSALEDNDTWLFLEPLTSLFRITQTLSSSVEKVVSWTKDCQYYIQFYSFLTNLSWI